MKNKKIFIIILIIAMIIPIPFHYKDGGSVEYKAILYSVYKHHTLSVRSERYGYETGISIKILGFEIYSNYPDKFIYK